MLELPGNLCLFDEPLDDPARFQSRRQEFFEGDFATDGRVLRTPDFAETALRNVVDEPITILRSRCVGIKNCRFEW